MYQAIFTDGYELQRFDPKKRLRPVVVKFDDLEKFLVKDAKGFLLNPTSTALPLRREQLPAFKKRIEWLTEKGTGVKSCALFYFLSAVCRTSALRSENLLIAYFWTGERSFRKALASI